MPKGYSCNLQVYLYGAKMKLLSSLVYRFEVLTSFGIR